MINREIQTLRRKKYLCFILLPALLLTAALFLTACGTGNSNVSTTVPSTSAPEVTSATETSADLTGYSTALQNTELFTYSDTEGLSPEDIAIKLAASFMDDLKTESDERTFVITEYKDLTVEVIATQQIYSQMQSQDTDYVLAENEISENTWVVEISVSYKYSGVYSPFGPSNDSWNEVLNQGSAVGFLLTKDGSTYTLQSRYTG